MQIYNIDEQEYFNSIDIINNAPIYCDKIKNGRMLIKKKLLCTDVYIYARLDTDKWIKNCGKIISAKHDKVFIKKLFVENLTVLYNELNGIVTEERGTNDGENIIIAPDILYLKQHEKFTDSDGIILEIETRGKQTSDGIYFRVKDVMIGFSMPSLDKNIKDSKSGFKKGIEYEIFTFDRHRLSDVKKRRKELFLTYRGISRILYSSQSEKAHKFIEWATKLMFTVQMGNTKQKQKLCSNILGPSAKTIIEVFNKNSREISCVYGFILGFVKDLRITMNIDKKYNDEDIVLKFGHTLSFVRRTSEHLTTYNKIKNCDLKLKFYAQIDPIYRVDAENDLKNYFKNFDSFLAYEKQEELVVLSPQNINIATVFYSEIEKKYFGTCTSLKQKLMDNQNESKTELMKTVTHVEKLQKDIENTTIIKDKDIEKLQKEIESITIIKNKDIEKLQNDIKMINIIRDKDDKLIEKELFNIICKKDLEISNINHSKDMLLLQKDYEIMCLKNQILSLNTIPK